MSDPTPEPPPDPLAREVLIRHGEQVYRLRLTAANKLILVK